MRRPLLPVPLALPALLALACVAMFAACSSSDATSSTVQLSQGCNINSDCQSPLVCAFRRCHSQCEDSRDCPSSQLCVASERPFHVCQLTDESKCTRTSDCAGSQLCGVDGACRDGCATDRDCLGGQKCATGTCADDAELDDAGKLPVDGDAATEQTGQPCGFDTDCPAPYVCRAGVCNDACHADADCPAGRACVDHACKPVVCGGQTPPADGGGSACQYDSQCEAPLVCRAGLCNCECLGDGDCPGGGTCIGTRCDYPVPPVDAAVE